ncbi:MAG: hypothetical protein LBT04_09475 [Prevotellaceae bacterium]|jgi:hypothetical protein|nr:hypothetical protein [Prevotellaceae bacterium]
MKRITILILALCTISANVAFGQDIKQQQQKVAMCVSGGQDAGINEMLSDFLLSAFISNGKYSVITRSASFLAELKKEQKYQQTGNVSDTEMSRLGRQFGVQLVCMITVKDVAEGKKRVSARLINIETAEIIKIANAISALSSMDELMNVAQDITAKLTSETVKENADGAKDINK